MFKKFYISILTDEILNALPFLPLSTTNHFKNIHFSVDSSHYFPPFHFHSIHILFPVFYSEFISIFILFAILVVIAITIHSHIKSGENKPAACNSKIKKTFINNSRKRRNNKRNISTGMNTHPYCHHVLCEL